MIIDINNEQSKLIQSAISRYTSDMWDDPEAYGFDVDDYKNNEELEKDIQKYIDDVVGDLIKKLNK